MSSFLNGARSGICIVGIALSKDSMKALICIALAIVFSARANAAQTPLPDLYHWFHTHPELSFQERETSKRFATELRAAGYDVTENVGGFGVVAMLKNG